MKYLILSDVHGCASELERLLLLGGFETCVDPINHPEGYQIYEASFRSPEGRIAVFAGDHVDRGPGVDATMHLIMDMVGKGRAVAVRGGHDQMLADLLLQYPDKETWVVEANSRSRQASVKSLKRQTPKFIQYVQKFLHGLPLVYTDENIIVTHAAYRPWLQGASFENSCLHGGTDGWSVDEDWKQHYIDPRPLFVGHRNMKEIKKTQTRGGDIYSIDTGCVYGNKLTGILWPENKVISVKAQDEYYPIQAHHWWY